MTNWSVTSLTPTTTTLTVAPSSTVTVGTSVTLTATISPAPPDGETVTFVDTNSNTTLGTATTTSGVATFTSTTIARGSYNVEAQYPGDTTHAASTSAGSALNVLRDSTTTALSIAPSPTVTAGTSVTLTATVSPVPPNGEIVTFVDTTSNTTLGTATTASGVAAFTSTAITGGSYNVEAQYPGDTTYAASTSASSALNVQDFTLGPTTLTINVSAPGQNGSGTITFGLLGGVTTAPSFTCSNLPSESTCTFTAASATTETVMIGTTAASSLIDGPLSRGNRIFYATLFPALVGLLWPAARPKSRARKSRARTIISFVAVLPLVILGLPACSPSVHHNPGTPVGQTNVTVRATSSTISHTITINLNVQ